MIDNQIERLIRGSLGLLSVFPCPSGLRKYSRLPERSSALQNGSSSGEINGDGSRLSTTRSFKRSPQPSLPVPIRAARTSSSIAATVSASTFARPFATLSIPARTAHRPPTLSRNSLHVHPRSPPHPVPRPRSIRLPFD